MPVESQKSTPDMSTTSRTGWSTFSCRSQLALQPGSGIKVDFTGQGNDDVITLGATRNL